MESLTSIKLINAPLGVEQDPATITTKLGGLWKLNN